MESAKDCWPTDNRFAIIKFYQDSTVDAVPSIWLDKTTEAVFCYWPRKNVSLRVKKEEIPDKGSWQRYQVSILGYAENYGEARKKVKLATVSSNLESDDEEPIRRTILKPSRYRLDWDNDEDEEPVKKTNRSHSEFVLSTSRPSFSPSAAFFSGRKMVQRAELSVPSPLTEQLQPSTTEKTNTENPLVSTVQTCTGIPVDTPATEGRDTVQEIPIATQGQEGNSRFERAVFFRLDKIEGRLLNIEHLLRINMAPELPEVQDILEKPCNTPHDLDQLCRKFNDCPFKQRVITALSLLGGKTPGDSVRRAMRRIGTNALWGNYSFKGRKGKKNFQEMQICSVIIQACRRTHAKVLEKIFEELISDTLKFAPHRRDQVSDQYLQRPSQGSVQSDVPEVEAEVV